MQAENRHAAGSGGSDLAKQAIKVLDGVGEVGQHRRDHHMTLQTCVADCGDETQTRLRRRRARLDVPVQIRITDRQ